MKIKKKRLIFQVITRKSNKKINYLPRYFLYLSAFFLSSVLAYIFLENF